MLGIGTLNTELYLDSQQTIINDLRDTFSCKQSIDTSNILKINTSTYSISRTANHIEHRLQQAEKRLKSIESSSMNKKRKDGSRSTQRNIRYNMNMNKIKNGKLFQTEINEIEVSMQRERLYLKSQAELIQILNKKCVQLERKNKCIQQLDSKLAKTEQQLLKIQQKYLKKQNSLIMQINRLKDLLETKCKNQTTYFNEKIQLQRILDENKLNLFSMSAKCKQLEQAYKIWHKKQGILKRTIRRLEDMMKKQYGQGNSKEILNIMKNIVLGGKEIEDFNNKQNENQNINRETSHKKKKKENCEEGIASYRSCTFDTEQKLPQTHRVQRGYKLEYNEQPACEELYRMLMLQAGTIEKLIS